MKRVGLYGERSHDENCQRQAALSKRREREKERSQRPKVIPPTLVFKLLLLVSIQKICRFLNSYQKSFVGANHNPSAEFCKNRTAVPIILY